MPWAPEGETVAVLARWRGPHDVLHEGLPDLVVALPGPCAVVCTRSWRAGGPLVEMRVLIPVRAGRRMRWWPVVAVADGAGGGTGTLTWTVERDRRSTRVVHWVDQDVTVRARPGRIAIPVRGGWGRIASGELTAPVRSRLAPLVGRHRAIVVGTPAASSSMAMGQAAASVLHVAPVGRPAIGGASPAASVVVEGTMRRIDCPDLALVSTLLVGTGA